MINKELNKGMLKAVREAKRLWTTKEGQKLLTTTLTLPKRNCPTHR